LTAHARVMAAIYRAIREATGARVIVDTSKTPWEAMALQHVEGISPRVVQMVRDPRAVAYSGLRQKAYMPTMGLVNSARHWVGFNLGAEAIIRRLPGASLFLRYEDCVRDPERWLQRVLDLIGCGSCTPPLSGGTVALGANHTVYGNPDRLKS